MEDEGMRTIFEVAAGADVHKEKITISVVSGNDPNNLDVNKWECRTFTEDLVAAGKKLLSLGVTDIAMESSGVYWRPVYTVPKPLN